jgi:hypothetical protein
MWSYASIPDRSALEVTMLTILLIIVVVLLLTGGGYGYSRRGRGV